MDLVKRFLAFDIGASSGRAVVGEWDGRCLSCSEIYNFPNEPVQVKDDLFWDVLRLFIDIKKGLIEYSRRYGMELNGIGIDTWGVDFALLDKDGRMLGNPHHYRDKRSIGMPEEIRKKIDAYDIYTATGVQVELVSTISQLYALAREHSPQLEIADTFLMMPSLFAYYLTGNKVDEHSNISNTALNGYKDDKPFLKIFEKLGIPKRVLPEAVKPGTVLGTLLPSVQNECGLNAVPVIAPATHDTASAVISVPADPSTNWAFLSCGTWSILGIETDEPLTSKEAFEAGITSAATADGKYMPRLNITGLWILQELRKDWMKQDENLDWKMMIHMAEQASSFNAFIDVDNAVFLNPPDMPHAISEYLQNTNQAVPLDKGTLIRIFIESLAMKYRDKLAKIEKLSGTRIEVLHLVGGGVKNTLLCQLTANAIGIPVAAGPVEATSVGNLLAQMVGADIFGSISIGRQMLKDSFNVVEYAPADISMWDEAYKKYLSVIKKETNKL